MEVYRVVLPADSKLKQRQLWRLGTFKRGEPRELELSKEQIRSLKARGFTVTKKAVPAPVEDKE
jgi:hypothetical protein